jgi:hypothetical protein
MTAPWRAVGLFVLLTICLSGIFWVLINATQTVNAAYIFGLMWMPAVAAILACRILGRPLRSLGLGTLNGRFVLIGYLIPIAYCLLASLGIWIFGFGGFPNTEFVRQTADSFGLGGAPDWVVIAMFVVLTGTTGMFTGVAVATGEDRLARCRPSAVVLAADVHRRRGGDQLRAGLASAEDRQLVAAHLSHEVDRRRPRSGNCCRRRSRRRRVLAQAWLATGETGCAGAGLGARGK